MRPWETWLTHISTILVAVSGIAYLWMKYALVNDDPFSVVNHPWQPAMLSLHVAAAPVLVFAAGLITNSHIRKKLEVGKREGRRSGLLSIITLPLMIASGYALQIITSRLLSDISLATHIISSSVFVIAYAAHQIAGLRSKAVARATNAGGFRRDSGRFAA
ncbi:MAG: hypothetical protein KIT09_16685 [Bryobacteraceae bacterium]|nr:hypothetical protein [Bryobacteraceae bacterium]